MLDSLQKKFNDKLVILPVTDEKKEVVEGFMKKLDDAEKLLKKLQATLHPGGKPSGP